MDLEASEIIISDLELEHILDSLVESSLEQIGTQVWARQMSMFEELNVQAALEADKGLEERVRDNLVERNKLPLIVYEMLVIELWREKVMPNILQMGEPKTSIQFYMILFNEANLLNLLETTLFHGPACESLEDTVIDLTDYCIRQLNRLVASVADDGGSGVGFDDDDELSSLTTTQYSEDDEDHSLADWAPGKPIPDLPIERPSQELDRHRRTTGFQLAMKSISVLRYLTDHLSLLTLSVPARMLITFDVPVMLVHLLEEKPWIRRDKVFEGNEWQVIQDPAAVQKVEGQVWLAVYNLLSKPECRDKYELNHYRRRVLLKLTRFLNDDVESQLPFLQSLKRWLLELELSSNSPMSSSNLPNASGSGSKTTLLIETIGQLRAGLCGKYAECYLQVAHEQAPLFLESNPSTSGIFDDEIATLLKTFDHDAVQQLITKQSQSQLASVASASASASASSSRASPCTTCHAPGAKQRCSRCHGERYCGRECQVKHWPKHKAKCAEKAKAAKVGSNKKSKSKVEEIATG